MDLHTHSTFSDGQYTPEQLLDLAVTANVQYFALTDHDTVDGCERLLRAKRGNIRVVSGVEFSAKSKAEVHILGYGMKLHQEQFSQFCLGLKQQRHLRFQRIVEYLKSQNVLLDQQMVLDLAGEGMIGRPHVAQVLVAQGYVASFRDAFVQYLGTPAFARLERPKPEAREIIEQIKQAGGWAVLAHPHSLKKSPQDLELAVAELVDCGLSGVECYYSGYVPGFIAICLQIAENHGLFATVGSDFHGENSKPEICLKTGFHNDLLNVPQDLFKKMPFWDM